MAENETLFMKICLAADVRYLQHLAVTMSSVLVNADAEDSLEFLILTDGSVDQDRLRRLVFPRDCQITVINAATRVRQHMEIINNPKWSAAAYYPLLLPYLCDSDERIIYLDCDIIVRSSLAGLWKMPMREAVAGVLDTGFDHQARLAADGIQFQGDYINSGVTIWNLEHIRSLDYEELLLDASKRLPNPGFVDQDWINIMFDNDKLRLLPVWNAMSHFFAETDTWASVYSADQMAETRANPNVVHFTNIKPWTMTYTAHPYWPEYWSYLKKSGFSHLSYKGWLKRIFLNKPDSFVLLARHKWFSKGHV